MTENREILERYPQLHRAVLAFAERIGDKTLKEMFVKCSLNTLTTTVRKTEKDVYLITGDIDAMWLRDSTAQVLHYLELAPDAEDVRRLIKGLLKRQFYYIACDPYANSFNFEWNGRGHAEDEGARSPIVWERKFELDSLCYPVMLADRYFRYTDDDSPFTEAFHTALGIILTVFETEQNHSRSEYLHYRPTENPSLSVPNRGKGGACAVTGMVWSGYRPSDDPCTYAYNIPENLFVAKTMDYIGEIASHLHLSDMAKRAEKLKRSILSGVEQYGIVEHGKFGRIYAYETDGLGHYNLMDDANIPSLLALPYLDCCGARDEIYRNTRKFVLSEANPYYFRGKVLSGIGSPHTPKGYVWPISLMAEALTTDREEEINRIVKTLTETTDGTGYMHEGIHKSNAAEYTRPWFAWANSLFSYLLIKKADKINSIQ